jgi:hypothetical protein
LLRFKDSELFLNHSLTSAKTLFNLLTNSIGLGLVIMKLVSSAYNTNLAFLAVTVGKLFIYNKNNKGPRIEPCGMPCLTSSQFD